MRTTCARTHSRNKGYSVMRSRSSKPETAKSLCLQQVFSSGTMMMSNNHRGHIYTLHPATCIDVSESLFLSLSEACCNSCSAYPGSKLYGINPKSILHTCTMRVHWNVNNPLNMQLPHQCHAKMSQTGSKWQHLHPCLGWLSNADF